MDVTSGAKADFGSGLQIRVLGSFSVVRDGEEAALPPSRKTRALLAYLAVAERPQRRERLCEMFWEIPDDPRGALRWSLSRLRQVVGNALDADRDTVTLRRGSFSLDHDRLKKGLSADLTVIDLAELEGMAAVFRGRFLEDLLLPRCPDFEAWRTALADEVELAELRVRTALVERLGEAPERALVHARALLALDPDNAALAAGIETLTEASRRRALTPSPPAPAAAKAAGDSKAAARSPQEIRYCTSADGVRIAYATTGSGYPILKCANWMSHLQYEWESTIWRHWIAGLSERHRLIRYDQRGNGLSDWDVDDFSFTAQLGDLDAVVAAACPDRFALLGISRGCALSVAYAARHPERVSHLILYGGRAKGWRADGDQDEIARRTAMMTLIRTGWGRDNPAFRQMFTSLFIPGATPEQMDWYNELQRRTISPENAVKFQEAVADVDVADLLKEIRVPTLVLHAAGDALVPFKAGRALAIGIPGAEFVSLDSRNHILLAEEPAFARLLGKVQGFVG